ncbi:MAG: GtrA family protein [Lachnospiraceae bacterium]|nr:GtrA family protein [Lachnospiraceae bacterium]
MFSKIWELYLKYKEVILYLVFGGLTTLVNIVTYAVFAYVFNTDTVTSTAGAWLVSVIFAYITNKIFVFESRTDTFALLFKECASFFGCRLATGIMDIAVMYVSVDLLHFNDIIMKIVSNVLVVVLNYIFSKLFIFKKEEA